jgi:hypothetical protein
MIDRLRANAMTEADRQMVVILLKGISKDEDVRDYFWESVTNRPKADEGGIKHAVAFVYEARVELKTAKPGKGLRGKIAEASGLTDDQIKYALKEYAYSVRAFIHGWNPEHIAQIECEQLAKLAERKGKK